MILSTGDLFLILVTVLVCTVTVMFLAVLVLRLHQRRSITFQFMVVVSAAIASILLSTVAISAEMYLSPHDLQVLFWVVGVSAVMSLAASSLTARSVHRALMALRDSVERVGRGDVIDAEEHGGKEFADVSAQLAEASERLAEARAEIERLDTSRRQFFAWISHDLRTPLTGVTALAEALDEGVVDNPAVYIRQIRAQARTMGRLVDDLFELSQIHSGTLRLRPQNIELLDIVSDSVSDVYQRAAARDIRIIHAGVEGRMLKADPHELARVIVNLLTNSIRHAPRGSEILISADQRGDDRIVLSVLDQGSGVESEDLSRMFEIGWRASTPRTPGTYSESSSGAGLGLAIVRGIVEAHGGDVHAEHAAQGFRLNVALPALSC